MKQRIRMEDIAKEIGVSKMCVSLALRGDPSISHEMRRRVHEVADSMGYIPNRIAKGLASGRTHTIAAIVGGDLHDGYHNQVLRAATEYALTRGYTLTIGLSGNTLHNEEEMYLKFQQLMVEGFLAFHSLKSELYVKLLNQGVPYVLYTKYFSDLPSDYVVCDDEHGGFMMTHHLYELGHRRIGFVYDAVIQESSEIVNRIRGYRAALEACNLPFDPALLLPNRFESLKAVFSNEHRPTALFVCNDVIAAATYIDIKRLGFRIPEDVSVGGYEGVYLGALLDPPLTTISTPLADMGVLACKRLIDKIEDDSLQKVVVRISLEPALTIRKSTKRREETVQ
ncbi:MAG: LacI family transcriptional regulator [Clostridia bacterium]|nr:LacI family transcriptional regulator [Clostridia bacterium]